MWLFSRKNSANDEELVKNYFLTGNKTLVGDLFERHVKTVYGVCLFYFRDNEKSKDCVMQIFEKLLVDLRKTEVKNFKAWLGFVVRNYCISELRKNKGKYFLPETYLDFEVMDSNLEQEEQISRINDELMLEQLKDCLSKLKENQRICVEAFYLKGLSYQQISETTNLTTNEVKSFIQNGKRNLKLIIEEKIKQQKHVA
jgi:RNA polymerase sigma factor (sigma-70 family)